MFDGIAESGEQSAVYAFFRFRAQFVHARKIAERFYIIREIYDP